LCYSHSHLLPLHPSPTRRSSDLLPASAKALGANERLNIGLIGTGGRCRHLMQALAKVPNTRMMALCDIYTPHLEQAQKLADPKRSEEHTSELQSRVDLVCRLMLA